MDNIILIGMPGSGKSTVGVLLAKMLGYGFVDTDILIQDIEKKRLFEILDDNGNEYFSECENRILAGIHARRTVIATGGSAVYGKEAMKHLKEMGKVVYLKVSLKELNRRVKNFSTRGIMRKPGQSLAEIFEERAPLYEKYADITVNCTGGTLEKNAKKIISALKKE